jgi:DNA-binding HxlR family transcriptional regulator
MVAPRPPISIYCEHYQAVIELIGRRWMGAILRVLMSDEPRRFNEVLAAIPGLSDRLLTERLRELTEHEIVERVPAPDISPIAIQYRLTNSGRDLEVVVRAISAWARRWRGGP